MLGYYRTDNSVGIDTNRTGSLREYKIGHTLIKQRFMNWNGMILQLLLLNHRTHFCNTTSKQDDSMY